MKVKDILPNREIEIMVRTNAPEITKEKDILFGFCKWDGQNLISLDGDSYSLDEEVTGHCYEDDGSLTYWIYSEWV